MSVTLEHIDGADLASSAAFLSVPRQVYRDDAGWAPQSEGVLAARATDAAAGRILMRGAVALAGGRPLARAAAIIEPEATAPDGAAEGWIGLFECMRGAEDAGRLVLDDCVDWLGTAGRTTVSAPRVDALVSGLITAGFDAPQTVFTPYNPDYYAAILSAAGFAPVAQMHAFRFDAATAPKILVPPGLGVTVRGVRLDDWDGELTRLHAFQEATFGGNVARVSRGLGQTGLLAGRLLPVVDPDLCLFVEDRRGETAGFLLCLPDGWEGRPEGAPPRRARLVSIGLSPGWRGKGAALAMAAALEDRLLSKGYQVLEASWIFSDNARPQALVRALGGRASRTATIYALAN